MRKDGFHPRSACQRQRSCSERSLAGRLEAAPGAEFQDKGSQEESSREVTEEDSEEADSQEKVLRKTPEKPLSYFCSQIPLLRPQGRGPVLPTTYEVHFATVVNFPQPIA
jgi:hypothetical protein